MQRIEKLEYKWTTVWITKWLIKKNKNKENVTLIPGLRGRGRPGPTFFAGAGA